MGGEVICKSKDFGGETHLSSNKGEENAHALYSIASLLVDLVKSRAPEVTSIVTFGVLGCL